MRIQISQLQAALLAILVSLSTLFWKSPSARAADHRDGPILGPDSGADAADLYVFLDPSDNGYAVLIATSHGLIIPDEAANEAIFDSVLRYRFEIENTGDARPEQFIDVTFSKRLAAAGPPSLEILQVPQPQTATIKMSGVAASFSALATNPSFGATAPAHIITRLGNTGVDFFAGQTDDPFYFDNVAFARWVGSIRDGARDDTQFNRQRDSFAGFNILSIALRVPVAMLKGNAGDVVGVSFVTQRRAVESPTARGEIRAWGPFETVDRVGLPSVNIALTPFSLKNEYNSATTKADALGKFAEDMVATLHAYGTTQPNIDILTGMAIENGDILRLNTNPALRANTGPGGGNSPGSGFPNGRRLRDDVMDTLLFYINNQRPLGDGLDANDVPLGNTFPFLAPPHQPLP